MIAASEFQCYLQKICRRYEQWWAVDALTETIADRQASFSFEQMVQTEEKKPEEKPQIVSLPILKAIENYIESEHILLVGSPGVGKSTALLRCLVSFAKEELGKPEPRIPVLVRLKRYNVLSSSEDPSGMLTLIRDALKPQLRLKIPEVEELLFQKRLILLLDGLNEMPADTVRTQLKAFREECDEIPLICTTRELGSGDMGIKRRLEVQPPSPPEIDRFLQECMPGQAQQVLQLLSRDNRELSRTPFVLWMLYQLFQETGAVVETLGEAFRQFFRSFKKYKEDAPVTDERRKAWNPWLEHLAFTMLDSPEPNDPGLVISDERAEKVLAERFGDLHGASSRIEELLKYHLLERASEKEVSFHHQLIQEYYAAESLLQYLPELLRDDEGEIKLKCHYLNYLKWTEPITIMLGLPEITENENHAKKIIEIGLDIDLNLTAKLIQSARQNHLSQIINLLENCHLSPSVQFWLFGKAKLQTKVDELMQLASCADQEVCYSAASALVEISSKINNPELNRFLENKGFIRVLRFDETPSTSLTVRDILKNQRRFEQSMTAREKLYHLSIGSHIADLIFNLWNLCSSIAVLTLLRVLFEEWGNPFSLDHFQEYQLFIKSLRAAQKINYEELLLALKDKDSCVRDIFVTFDRLAELNLQEARDILVFAVKYKSSELLQEEDNKGLYEITSVAFSQRVIESLNQRFIRDIFELILSIQSRCQFYNYNIHHYSFDENKTYIGSLDASDASTENYYEDILSIIFNTGWSIAKSSKELRSRGEEALRDIFLPAINAKHKGAATGETRNKDGKTDILVRIHGEDLLIAECKFWEGEEHLKKTLDQLLGYATMRDTRLAMLIFSRNKNFTNVKQKIAPAIKQHPNFGREVKIDLEKTWYQFVIFHPDDQACELTLTVLAFHISL